MYYFKPVKFLIVIFLFSCAVLISAVKVKFIGLNCKNLPAARGFNDFEYCRLKAINRYRAEISLKVNLYEVPVHSVTTRVQLFKRLNGFKPFLYNIEFDFCKLMNATNYRVSFEKFVFGFVRNFSNLNQTCPWKAPYVIVEKFGLENVALPAPSGIYRIDLSFAAYGVYRAVVALTVLAEE